MLTVEHNLAEIERALAKKAKVLEPASLTRIGIAAGKVTGLRLENTFREYPPEPSHELTKRYTRTGKDGKTYQSKFKSLKQQRYVLWLLKTKGRYTRKGNLGRSLYSVSVALNQGTISIQLRGIGYSQYVIGNRQIEYHQTTGWPLVKVKVTTELDAYTEVYKDTYIALLERQLKG